MPKLEFVLCTMGTRGDFLPFLALAKALLTRGYRATLLTNANWRDETVAAGVDFHAIANMDPPQTERDDILFFTSNVLDANRNSFFYIASATAAGRNCALIFQLNMLGAECAAEKFDLLKIKIALQPSALRSFKRPPWPLTQLAVGPIGVAARYTIIPALYAVSDLLTPHRTYINRFRRSVGVRALPFGSRRRCNEDLLLVMCPDWFAIPQSDWPPTCRMVGFPFHDNPTPDPEAAAFIAENGAPIVYTQGTGVTDAREILARAQAMFDRLGLPGILLNRNATTPETARIPILARPYVDFSWLLPQSQLLVHHGGIGSMAQALRAGIPQIVIPDRFDQPDNGFRIAALGLGGVVYEKHSNNSDFSALLKYILHNENIRRRVKDAADLIRRQNTIDETVRHIEQTVMKRSGIFYK